MIYIFKNDEEAIKRIISERIYFYMELDDINESQLAQKAKCNVKTIKRLLSKNYTNIPSLSILIRIANVFDILVVNLIED